MDARGLTKASASNSRQRRQTDDRRVPKRGLVNRARRFCGQVDANPMQCRGQIDGAIAMGICWALTENMVHGADGAMVNPTLRDYRIPAFA